MPTGEQIHDAWMNDRNLRYVEYKFSYFKTPTKREPMHHWTFQWTRLYTLTEARKRAMYMINRGMVSPNSITYLNKYSNISNWVEISKHTSSSEGERDVGILVKIGDDFYWKGAMSGGFHRVLPNGSISSKASDVKIPLVKTARKRRS